MVGSICGYPLNADVAHGVLGCRPEGAICEAEFLTNRVSTLRPRCSATTLRLLLFGRAGLRVPDRD